MMTEIKFKFQIGEIVYQKTTGSPFMILSYFIDANGIKYMTDDGELRYDFELEKNKTFGLN